MWLGVKLKNEQADCSFPTKEAVMDGFMREGLENSTGGRPSDSGSGWGIFIVILILAVAYAFAH